MEEVYGLKWKEKIVIVKNVVIIFVNVAKYVVIVLDIHLLEQHAFVNAVVVIHWALAIANSAMSIAMVSIFVVGYVIVVVSIIKIS